MAGWDDSCAVEFYTACEADRSAVTVARLEYYLQLRRFFYTRSSRVVLQEASAVMSKDGARLSRLGVLAPAALSACMDASVLAVPAAGAIVSTVLKELSKAFMLKK